MWRLVENRDKSTSWYDKFLSRKHKKRINVVGLCIQGTKLLITCRETKEKGNNYLAIQVHNFQFNRLVEINPYVVLSNLFNHNYD